MKVLAIDPGYGRCGIAVIERVGIKDVVRFSACIETDPKNDFPARLREVVEACESLMAGHEPDCVAMEKLFFKANRTTAMKVAEVRGAIISLAASRALAVHEYGPAEVKNAVAGWGGADKKQIATMLHALVKIDKPIKLDDEYDAIAVGVTHLAHAGVNRIALRKTVQ